MKEQMRTRGVPSKAYCQWKQEADDYKWNYKSS